MCGIAACWMPEGVPQGLMESMNRVQHRRGPDHNAVRSLFDGRIGLAHTRLSVIDPSAGAHQPMVVGGGKHWLVFNGEIYNFKKLRMSLAQEGVHFRTHSDTEVLLRLLRAKGPEALHHVEGMFAFVYVNLEERYLLAARDRLGIKPLAYFQTEKSLAFASTITPLQQMPEFNGRIDLMARFEMLVSKYICAPRSIYSQIRKVMPGTYLLASLDAPQVGLQSVKYWTPRDYFTDSTALLDEDEWLERLRCGVEQAVRRQLVADVPIGILLSGGVDSSLVAAVAQQQCGPVRTFSVGFDVPGYDESTHAAAVAAHLGTKHREFRLSPSEVVQSFSSVTEAYDEPFGDASAVAMSLVSRKAREDVTVALSGDGGDEQFFGYKRYHYLARAYPFIRRIPSGLRRLALSCAGGAPRSRIGHAIAAMLGHPGEQGLYTHYVLENFATLAELSGAGSVQMLWGSGLSEANDRGASLSAGAFCEGMMLADLGNYMVDDCLTKVDRASMHHSLEMRVPLLDEEVLRASFSMPFSMKWRGGQGKYLLRRLLYEYVPQALVDRPKMGFGLPLDEWLFSELSELSGELLSRENLLRVDLDPDGVAKIIAAHKAGRADYQYFLWPLCCYVSWSLNAMPAGGDS